MRFLPFQPFQPSWRLWLPLIVAVAALVLALLYMLSQPWMGLSLQAKKGHFYYAGAQLVAINGIALQDQDAVEDPNAIESGAAYSGFMAQQNRLHQALEEPTVQLSWKNAAGQEVQSVQPVQHYRPIASLPLDFWVQCAVGLLCMLVGSWVWALRPQDSAASLFAVTGFCVLLFALAAACYSSRNLTLAQADFEWLAAINRLGATGYGFAGMAFFLRYPLPLVPVSWLWVFVLALLGLNGAMLFGGLAPFATQAITGLQMLAIVSLILLQGWLCRKRPLERAALIWLGLSLALGAGSFMALQVLPLLLGRQPLVTQGMSFVLFLLPYIGIALGLTRYRLFDVGNWAFRLLFFMGGGLLLLLLDLALIWLLEWSDVLALSAAVLLIGFVYLPLRDWLQRRMALRAELPRNELFARAMGVAFAADVAQRQMRWEALLGKLFQPLQMEKDDSFAGSEVEITEGGLVLRLPAVADLSAMRLAQADQGRGLFSPTQAQLAERLLDLLAQAQASRQAYERGVHAERQRVAQDLHDDVGARLLTALHRSESALRPLLQETLNEVRGVAHGLADTGSSLSLLLPEWRQEAARRCEAADLQLDWPITLTADLVGSCPQPQSKGKLDYRARRALLSVLREAVSNTLKHAGAKQIVVRYEWVEGDTMQLDIWDDGCGLSASIAANPAQPAGLGLGMPGLMRRVQRIGGQLQWLSASERGLAQGTLLRLHLPLASLLGQWAADKAQEAQRIQ